MASENSFDRSLEAEVRNLVRKVVDNVLAAGGSADSATTASASQASGDSSRQVAIGADHGGFRLKQALAETLRGSGWTVVDCGTFSEESVDYPDLALAVAEKVSSGTCSQGIVVDGAGIGSAMAANKVPGVRAALCYDLSSARNSREHNHANVLTLGAGLIGTGLAQQIVETWLDTPWGPDRHARRVEKITNIEQRYAPAGATGSSNLETKCSCHDR